MMSSAPEVDVVEVEEETRAVAFNKSRSTNFFEWERAERKWTQPSRPRA
jgi:hypothetical protein